MATEIVKTIKVETVGADKSVKSLRDNIKQLRNDLLNLDKGTKEYDDTLSQIIKDETELTQVMRAGKDEVAQALKKVTGEYVTQKQELKALKVELEQLQPGTDAYNEKFSRAAEITANLKQQQELLKYASNDLGDQLSNMRGIMANVAAGFSAAQAAIGLFGGESKEVQQAMLKVQQAMALVQGLEGLDGFIKRTKGLSAAIQGWVTQSKAATVQTTAQATATKAAATATNAETVATQGATVAQKGLNAAMKANPVGIVVAALALLVANWKKVVEWIGKAVGGFDKLNKAMNKFKATVSGVGNAIKKVLLVPIKEAINYVTTLGKILKDVFTLNWDEIGKDIKEGINNSVNIVKDGYDVAGNYAEGKEKEITRQAQAEIKKRSEKRAKELQDMIDAKEAELGEDWKYTEEAKSMYDEMFDQRMAQYDKDSEEYRKAQNDKLKYDRQFTEHKTKTDKANAKKAADAAKKAKEKLLKVEEDYRSKVEKITIGSYKEAVKEFEEEVNALSEYYNGKVFNKDLLDALERYKKEYKDITTDMAAWFKSLNQDSSLEYNAGFNVFKWYNEGNRDDYKKFLQLSGEEMRNAIGKIFDDGENFYKNKLETEMFRIGKLNRAIINDAIDNGGKEANRKINDQILQIFEKNIRPKVSDEVAKLQNDINNKTIKLDFEIETGFDGDEWIDNEELIPIKNFDKRTAELERATAIYQNALQQLLVQRKYYAETADYAELMGYTDSNEYEQAVIQIETIDNQLNQVHADYYRTNAEIRDRYFAEDLNKIQQNANAEQRLVQQHYNELFTENSNYLNGRRQLSGVIVEHDLRAAEESYQIQKNALEQQKAMYESYLQDVTVAGEQRVEAEKMVAELIAQIEEGEVAHTREMNELRIQSFQMWYGYVQDAIGGIGDLFGSLADYYEADIKAKQDKNEISEQQAEEMYEKVKALKISEAVISTISGAIGAFMQAVSAYPPPWGEILGGISAAAVTAAGVAQIAQIKQQKLGSSSASPSAMATPQTQVYEPSYVENPTQTDEISNLRNAYMEQPIYVRVSDIDSAQEGRRVRTSESSF